MADITALDRLESLVSPFGIVGSVSRNHAPRGLENISIFISYFGDRLPVPNTRCYSTADQLPRFDLRRSRNIATGRRLGDVQESRVVAIAEGAERYAGSHFNEAMIYASRRELDGAVLDPSRIPQCSASELSATGCPLRELDPDAPIRWMRGVDLVSGTAIWLPAIMVCYCLRNPAPSERFWNRLSTGYAAHTDPVEALVRGVCEVIERDAIAVSWLQKLPLPVIADGVLSDETTGMLDWSRRHFIESYLFDATTDMAVPTVFCLQVAPHDERAAQIMGCATGRSIQSAAQHALLEACTSRSSFYTDEDLPANFADFKVVSDGARYMAERARAGAFGFLVDGARDRVAPARPWMPADSREALAWLIAVLARKDMQVIAVDRTTSELSTAGLTAVSVVIPDLQPMSLVPLAQYRAHPRLYAAPKLMGYPVLTEEELNQWPIPYA